MEDLQNAIDNVSPEMTEANETAHLRSIFPDEIWDMIISKIPLTDPSHLQNLSIASPYFYSTLLDRQVEFLFPLVFPHLAKLYQPHSKQFETRTYSPNDNILSYECDKFLVNNRRVCRAWRNGVDTYLQNHSSHYETFLDKNRWFHQISGGTHFRLSHRNARAFLNHFTESHGTTINPFVSRSVGLKVGGVNEVNNVLELFGHHIWYCDIFLGDYTSTFSTYYKTIMTLVKNLPNLKILNLVFKPFGEPRRDQEKIMMQCQLEDLQQEIKAQPFPKFKNLVMLKSHDLPGPMFNEMIRRNNHVKMLEPNISTPEVAHGSYNIWSVKLPKLTHLSISFHKREDVLKLGDPEFTWKLEKLHVDHVQKICEYVSFKEVIEIIESKWSNTLTDLSLCLPPPQTQELIEASYEEYPKLQLNFPKLKKLRLVLWNMLPLDLLLPAKENLEYLHVIVHVKIVEGADRAKQLVEMRNKQQVKFVGRYWAKMEQSNIWELCQQLELMNVEVFSTHISQGVHKPRTSHYKRTYWRKEYLKYVQSLNQPGLKKK